MSACFVLSHNNAREGAPTQCAKLACALHRSGCFSKVFLCALRAGVNPDTSIAVIGIHDLAARVRSILDTGHEVRVIFSTVICTRLASMFRIIVGREKGLRLVGLVHEVRNETFSWVLPKHLSGLDRISFVARYTADSYGPEYVSAETRTVIPNWLSPAEMALVDATPEDRTRPIVLSVGVVGTHKGHLHAAMAVAKLRIKFPEYRHVIVGHVYNEDYAAQVKAASPGAIELVGPVDRAEVIRLMRTCRVFLHGSPMESCCLSVMEAMCCGCPVVAARVGGIPEEVTDGEDGLLYEFDDHEACCALLEKLAASEELRARLGGAARRTVDERFREEDKVDAYRALLLG